MNSQHTPKQSAAMLSVSVSTLRRIADEFSEHLPDYQPVKGERRTFTDSDLRTVYAILSRLQASPGLTRSALLAEMSTPDSDPLVIPAILPTDTPDRPQERPDRTQNAISIPEAIESPQTALAPFLAAQDVTQTQIAELSARIEMLSADRPQPTQATPLVVASLLSVGALIVAVTVSALFQWPMAGVAGCAFALFVLVIGLVSPSVRT